MSNAIIINSNMVKGRQQYKINVKNWKEHDALEKLFINPEYS